MDIINDSFKEKLYYYDGKIYEKKDENLIKSEKFEVSAIQLVDV